MHLRRTIRRFKSWLKPAFAGVCVTLLLGIIFVSASAPLHGALHTDDTDNGHDCAVCAFVHGKVDAVAFSAVTPAPIKITGQVFPFDHSVVLPAVKFLLLPERAPPVLS